MRGLGRSEGGQSVLGRERARVETGSPEARREGAGSALGGVR